jgi:hypothetical protein
MTSRERLILSLKHIQPDFPPMDLGSTAVTGIHALALNRLREALSIGDKPVIVYEVLQQLGMVDDEDIRALGIDIVGITPYKNFVGVETNNFKPYQNHWGIKAQIAGNFEYDILPDGRTVAYPQGDKTVPPCFLMPSEGYFFDPINRSEATVDDDFLDPVEDYKESFGIMSDTEARYYEKEAKRLYEKTTFGIIGNLAPAGFGDAALIPGANLKYTKGIRKVEEWMIAHKLKPEYVHKVYEYQTEIALKNLEIYKQSVGNQIQAIFMGGTDFGMQNNELMSVEDFREFYKPYWKKVNDWVHQNTDWKTFYHSCGSIYNLIDEMIDAGADILNPVQCSAHNMDAISLKERFGDRIVFWGGGIDTQKILPFGTPQECYDMTLERLRIFSKNGGFVFNPVHNIQANTPIENILSMFEAIKKFKEII